MFATWHGPKSPSVEMPVGVTLSRNGATLVRGTDFRAMPFLFFLLLAEVMND